MKTRDGHWSDQFVVRGGRYYIRYEVARWSEPILDVMYWPVSRWTNGGARVEDLPLPAHSCGEGSYTVRRERDLDKPQLGFDAFFTVYLENGGQTKADPALGEHLAIEAPKVRKGIEVRYKDGAWQKYSKREGWIHA